MSHPKTNVYASQLPRLPIEVIGHVALYADRPTLRALILLSRTVQAEIGPMLFHTLVFPLRKTLTLDHFLATVSTDTRKAAFVRSLALPASFYHRWSAALAQDQNWFKATKFLSDGVRALTALRELRILFADDAKNTTGQILMEISPWMFAGARFRLHTMHDPVPRQGGEVKSVHKFFTEQDSIVDVQLDWTSYSQFSIPPEPQLAQILPNLECANINSLKWLDIIASTRLCRLSIPVSSSGRIPERFRSTIRHVRLTSDALLELLRGAFDYAYQLEGRLESLTLVCTKRESDQRRRALFLRYIASPKLAGVRTLVLQLRLMIGGNDFGETDVAAWFDECPSLQSIAVCMYSYTYNVLQECGWRTYGRGAGGRISCDPNDCSLDSDSWRSI